ncbi:hypothetical protein JHK87_039371 [Glycine soja]|nr:hypothetical protein JHK87_039371 [Glycine soja]
MKNNIVLRKHTTYVDPKKDVHIYFDHAVDDTPEIVMVIEDDVGVGYNGKIGEEEDGVDHSVPQGVAADTEKSTDDVDRSVPLGDEVLAEKYAKDVHPNVQEVKGVTSKNAADEVEPLYDMPLDYAGLNEENVVAENISKFFDDFEDDNEEDEGYDDESEDYSDDDVNSDLDFVRNLSAYVVMDVEDKENWKWFLTLLHQDLGDYSQLEMVCFQNAPVTEEAAIEVAPPAAAIEVSNVPTFVPLAPAVRPPPIQHANTSMVRVPFPSGVYFQECHSQA